jgi:hypothetical protein
MAATRATQFVSLLIIGTIEPAADLFEAGRPDLGPGCNRPLKAQQPPQVGGSGRHRHLLRRNYGHQNRSAHDR